MEAFLPLMSLVLVYLFIAILSKTVKKASQAQKKTSPASAAPAGAAEAPPPKAPAEPETRELQPTIRLHEHDDSVYRGSLNAVTGEGYDPCHEDQLKPLSRSEAVEHVPVTTPGLQLHWTGDEIVRGFVVSEILKRKGS